MNQKRRSKVRAQATAESGSIVHPDLLGFDLRRPFDEWPESVKAAAGASVKPAPASPEALQAANELLEPTPLQQAAREALDRLEGSVGRLEVTVGDFAKTELPVGARPVEYVTAEELVKRYPEPNRSPTLEMQAPDEWGRYRMVRESAPPNIDVGADSGEKPAFRDALLGDGHFAIVLGELWTARLEQMAKAADCTPRLYLERLLARAWTAMPRRDRIGG